MRPLLIIGLLLICGSLQAQSYASKLFLGVFKDGYHYYSAGGTFTDRFFGEAGVGIAQFPGFHGYPFGQAGYSLACEVSEMNDQWIVGPKLSYTVSVLLLNAGVNVIYYQYGSKGQPYFRPQVGLSLNGLADVVYGYNLPISSDPLQSRLEPVNTHRISFVIRIPSFFWENHGPHPVPAVYN